ncbi:MAG: hypothetical protein LBU29_01980, partial [Endomicrobium sp.]|nr:hypothetical protein [Endomicrobium sp.]
MRNNQKTRILTIVAACILFITNFIVLGHGEKPFKMKSVEIGHEGEDRGKGEGKSYLISSWGFDACDPRYDVLCIRRGSIKIVDIYRDTWSIKPPDKGPDLVKVIENSDASLPYEDWESYDFVITLPGHMKMGVRQHVHVMVKCSKETGHILRNVVTNEEAEVYCSEPSKEAKGHRPELPEPPICYAERITRNPRFYKTEEIFHKMRFLAPFQELAPGTEAVYDGKEKFVIDSANNEEVSAGRFYSLTKRELREKIKEVPRSKEKGEFRIIEGPFKDIKEMVSEERYNGATFQVVCGLNGTELPCMPYCVRGRPAENLAYDVIRKRNVRGRLAENLEYYNTQGSSISMMTAPTFLVREKAAEAGRQNPLHRLGIRLKDGAPFEHPEICLSKLKDGDLIEVAYISGATVVFEKVDEENLKKLKRDQKINLVLTPTVNASDLETMWRWWDAYGGNTKETCKEFAQRMLKSAYNSVFLSAAELIKSVVDDAKANRKVVLALMNARDLFYDGKADVIADIVGAICTEENRKLIRDYGLEVEFMGDLDALIEELKKPAIVFTVKSKELKEPAAQEERLKESAAQEERLKELVAQKARLDEFAAGINNLNPVEEGSEEEEESQSQAGIIAPLEETESFERIGRTSNQKRMGKVLDTIMKDGETGEDKEEIEESKGICKSLGGIYGMGEEESKGIMTRVSGYFLANVVRSGVSGNEKKK